MRAPQLGTFARFLELTGLFFQQFRTALAAHYEVLADHFTLTEGAVIESEHELVVSFDQCTCF